MDCPEGGRHTDMRRLTLFGSLSKNKLSVSKLCPRTVTAVPLLWCLCRTAPAFRRHSSKQGWPGLLHVTAKSRFAKTGNKKKMRRERRDVDSGRSLPLCHRGSGANGQSENWRTHEQNAFVSDHRGHIDLDAPGCLQRGRDKNSRMVFDARK
jgi:hypothetical protein